MTATMSKDGKKRITFRIYHRLDDNDMALILFHQMGLIEEEGPTAGRALQEIRDFLSVYGGADRFQFIDEYIGEYSDEGVEDWKNYVNFKLLKVAR